MQYSIYYRHHASEENALVHTQRIKDHLPPDGEVRENSLIRQIVISTGVVTTLAGTEGSTSLSYGTGTSASFYTPRGITTDGTNLYVSDTDNNLVRKIE